VTRRQASHPVPCAPVRHALVDADQVGIDFAVQRHHGGPLQAVLQLAHVAGPGVLRQAALCGGGQAQCAALDAAQAFEKMTRDFGQVFHAFAQRWRQDGHDVEPVVQILAELAGLDRRFEIAMGRRDQPHIHLDRAAAAHALQFALLQHAQQLGLKGRRDLADFVEEQRAAVGHFEAALARTHGAGKGTLLVAEEFRLEQVSGSEAQLRRT